jgi:hypothetical protein
MAADVVRRQVSVILTYSKDWEILNGACSELSGTKWKDNPEFCPTLSHVVEPEVLLPGITSRASVQEEIERLRIVAVNRTHPSPGSSLDAFDSRP